MEFHHQLRRRLRLNFLLWVLFIAIGFGVFIVTSWNSEIKDAGEQSKNKVSSTSLMLKHSILDASKLLDIIKKDLELNSSQVINQNEFDKKLAKGLNALSVHFDITNYGIIYLIDKTGALLARSDNKPLNNINFSDRYFFHSLRANPDLRFVVGPTVKARTTGKSIFTMASPVKDVNGNFAGVLGLQMDTLAMENLLSKHLHNTKGVITVLAGNNEIILTLPLSNFTPNSQGGIPFEKAKYLEAATNDDWLREGNEIISKTSVPEVGITIISQINTPEIWHTFVYKNIKLFLLLFGAAVICSLLILRLNNKILDADKARINSNIDGLTQIPNRRAFDERYEVFLKDARRNQHPVSILFIDIDHFKRCNDSYGHENGDIVLKKVAELIQKCMQRPLDFCCRWGGEEMVCLLPDTDLAGAEKLAVKILKTIEQESILIKDFPPIHVTVSIGISSADHTNALLQNNLVDKADQAMYRAKQNGRNRYSV